MDGRLLARLPSDVELNFKSVDYLKRKMFSLIENKNSEENSKINQLLVCFSVLTG